MLVFGGGLIPRDKKDRPAILTVRLPQGDGLHLSETKPEFLAGAPRKISPVYPPVLTALQEPVGQRLERYTIGSVPLHKGTSR